MKSYQDLVNDFAYNFATEYIGDYYGMPDETAYEWSASDLISEITDDFLDLVTATLIALEGYDPEELEGEESRHVLREETADDVAQAATSIAEDIMASERPTLHF